MRHLNNDCSYAGVLMREMRKIKEKSHQDMANILGANSKTIYRIEEGSEVPEINLVINFLDHFSVESDKETADVYREAQRIADRDFNVNYYRETTYNESNETYQYFPLKKGPDDSKLLEIIINTLWNTSNTLNTSYEYKLPEREIEHMGKTVFPLKNIKITLLLFYLDNWEDINRDKDPLLSDNQKPILEWNSYFKTEENITEFFISISFNKVTFRCPESDEDYIKPLINIFPGTRYKDYLLNHPDFDTDDNIIQIEVFNPNSKSVLDAGHPSDLVE